jgi:RNA polymerase sigma-70 factor (ECF subfamily)
VDLDSENLLVRRWRTGDRRAFEALFWVHRHRAYRLAYRLMGSPEDADDVLQEAWMRAFKAMSDFDGRARFGTWLFRIVLRTAADERRRQRRRSGAVDLHLTAENMAAKVRYDPSEGAQVHELEAALQTALRVLPAEQCAALVLVSFEGMTYAEAAEVQQCPEGTLAWRISEARRRLVELLAPHLESKGTNDAM